MRPKFVLATPTCGVKDLLHDISACTLCARHLPLGPRPVVRAHPRARIVVIGQAPGARVHASGIPWDDASGRELRRWLGVDEEQFYNEELFSLMPMGFCYPGKGTSGDLPPRPECAPQWHPSLWARLREVRLTVLIGAYAQAHYLGAGAKASLTGTVQSYAAYLPRYFPLPHPSPRNRPWQSKHPWFPQTVLPALQKQVRAALA